MRARPAIGGSFKDHSFMKLERAGLSRRRFPSFDAFVAGLSGYMSFVGLNLIAPALPVFGCKPTRNHDGAKGKRTNTAPNFVPADLRRPNPCLPPSSPKTCRRPTSYSFA
jgi:hypothetical protein